MEWVGDEHRSGFVLIDEGFYFVFPNKVVVGIVPEGDSRGSVCEGVTVSVLGAELEYLLPGEIGMVEGVDVRSLVNLLALISSENFDSVASMAWASGSVKVLDGRAPAMSTDNVLELFPKAPDKDN